MTEKTRKTLGEAKTDFAKRTLAYIEPLLTEMNEEDIEGKKLTLAKCWTFCHDKGRDFAEGGCADISPEQERAWVREYFGIAETPEPTAPEQAMPESVGEKQLKRLDVDFGSLLE